MASFIFRQPNGLLGRFSTITDCPTHYNMTDSEYIEMCVQQAREEAIRNLSNKSFIKPYKTCIYAFVPGNMSQMEFDQVCDAMETEDKAKTRQNIIDSFLDLLFEDYRDGQELMNVYRKFNRQFIDFVRPSEDCTDEGELSMFSQIKKAKIGVAGLAVGINGINSISLIANNNLTWPPLVFLISKYAELHDKNRIIDSVSYAADTNSLTITFC